MDNPDNNTHGGLDEYTKYGCSSQIETASLSQIYNIMIGSCLALAFFIPLGAVALLIAVGIFLLSIYVFSRGITHQREKRKGEIIEDGYNVRERFINFEYLMGYSIALGTLAGITCSTIVHFSLFLLSGNQGISIVLTGIPLGLITGAPLGAFCGFIVHGVYKDETMKGDSIKLEKIEGLKY